MALEVGTVVQVLMQQHNRLFSYIWTIVGDTQLAEDAMQQLSLVAIKKGVDVADEYKLVHWLIRAARNEALKARRTKSRLPTTLEDSVADQLELQFLRPRLTSSDAAAMDALDECVRRLSERNREILRLRYVQGRKTGEIAHFLNRNVEAVYQSISRIHGRLRKCVELRLRDANA